MLNKIYDKFKKYIKVNYKSLIFLIICLCLVLIKIPYVVYAPGGTINTSKRIKIENGYKYKGSLDMAYVTMYNGSIIHSLLSFVIPNWDLISNKKITLEDESIDEMIERDKLFLEESLDSAAIVSYKYANKKLDISKQNNTVIYLSKDSNSDLKIGDSIISIDGVTINNLNEYREQIKSKEIGTIINYEILRNNKKTKAYAEVIDIEGANTGIIFITTYEFDTDPKLTYILKESESGPSGGLMLTLSIYNNLIKEDITKGKKIVGTGTIDVDGNVGEIGGVKYKLIAAVKAKAEIFLCPKENYAEAIKVKKENNYDIKIIKVSTFEEALIALKNI